MTNQEFDLWVRYRNKYGPMNPIRMYDQGPALISSIINNAHGGKAKAKDFIVYGKEQKEEAPDIHEFVAALGARIGKRR